MLRSFFAVFEAFFMIFKYPVYLVLAFLVVFFVLCCIWFCIRFSQGKRLQKGQHHKLKKEGFFYRLFYKLPRQYVDDIFARSPDFFKYQGCVIFEGRQGAGKTIGMVEYATRMLKEYPLAKSLSNLGFTMQNEELEDWKKLMSYKNGIYGVVVLIDELQNWFSSMDSKDFPPEMLEVITQNRKNRRIILGTAQNFYLLAKAIRSQATEVRRCATLLGCLTIVLRYEPYLDSEGNVKKFKFRGMYFFIHDKELRESYNTWLVIKRLKKVGFQGSSLSQEIINKFYIDKKGLK